MRAAKVERDPGLDALRGLAIVAMVASHLARDVLATPHPFELRLFGTLAAPLFITLAGMLTAQTSLRKNREIGYYIRRGAAIVLLAAALDVFLWRIYPFVGCDVLYLIGVAIPLTALFSRLSIGWQAGVMATVVLLPSLLRATAGYPDEVLAVALSDSPWELILAAPIILQQWVYTGWFPLFPWLGFSLLGVWLFRLRQTDTAQATFQLRFLGAVLLGSGLTLGWVQPMPYLERSGYTELFYPPTISFLLAASGAVTILFSLTQWSWLKDNQPLIQLGRCPLLMYLVHLAILHWAIMPLFGEVQLVMYFSIFAALLLLLVGMAGAVAISKQANTRQLPLVVRLLLGS